MSIAAHGQPLRLQERPGVIARAWRQGVPYESPLLEHIYHQRFKGLALDVGANIGNHALWLSVVCGLRVIAFEPVHHDALRANVALNPAANIVVEPFALGDAEGVASHVGKGELEARDDGQIPVRTLDSLQLPPVSVMKVDVEGMESAVFRGGERTILWYRPVIYAEAWDDAAEAEQAGILGSWGYRKARVFPQRGQRGETPVIEWRPA